MRGLVVTAAVAGRVLRIELEYDDAIVRVQPESPPLLDARTRAEATAAVENTEDVTRTCPRDNASAPHMHRPSASWRGSPSHGRGRHNDTGPRLPRGRRVAHRRSGQCGRVRRAPLPPRSNARERG